ncbi:3667_t:CDS:2 [Acaulospora colombiana]|uniref:3667_t:CDS:1 n=1 Tax=Acaulospora colombiana TaxID=27376 RepID=A0ACA9KH68_9GLOM|nr:3667_t:CDS:2 [Acaulospora colombiana]
MLVAAKARAMLFSRHNPPTATINSLSAKRLSNARNLTHTRKISQRPDIAKSVIEKPRLDFKGIAENADYHAQNLRNRKIPKGQGLVEELKEVHKRYMELRTEVIQARTEQNIIGKKIKSTQNPQERRQAINTAAELKNFLAVQEPLADATEATLLELGLQIPNITHPNSPIGPEALANVLSKHGPEPLQADIRRDHWTIAKQLDIIRFEEAATTTGSFWYFLRGAAALLEQALINYSLSTAIKHGYTPISTPDVVKADIASRCGFSPRDAVDVNGKKVNHLYHLEETSNDLVLTGTAEIPLAGMFTHKTFFEKELPQRLVGVGHAFRSEAGSRGAMTRGLYRVHQFTKVELFALTEQKQSEAMMEEIRQLQIQIFEGLGFPFRVLDMPTEELGHAAYRKYDIEAWMPGRDGQLELKNKALPFAHTLNGTAAAIPRLIIALLENGVVLNDAGQPVGIRLPSTLRPFWFGEERLGPYTPIHWFDPTITTQTT